MARLQPPLRTWHWLNTAARGGGTHDLALASQAAVPHIGTIRAGSTAWRPLVLLQGAGDTRDDGGRQHPSQGDQQVGQRLEAAARPVPGRALAQTADGDQEVERVDEGLETACLRPASRGSGCACRRSGCPAGSVSGARRRPARGGSRSRRSRRADGPRSAPPETGCSAGGAAWPGVLGGRRRRGRSFGTSSPTVRTVEGCSPGCAVSTLRGGPRSPAVPPPPAARRSPPP